MSRLTDLIAQAKVKDPQMGNAVHLRVNGIFVLSIRACNLNCVSAYN